MELGLLADMVVDLEVGMVVDMEIRGVNKIVIGVGQLDLNFFSLKLNTQFTHLFLRVNFDTSKRPRKCKYCVLKS